MRMGKSSKNRNAITSFGYMRRILGGEISLSSFIISQWMVRGKGMMDREGFAYMSNFFFLVLLRIFG